MTNNINRWEQIEIYKQEARNILKEKGYTAEQFDGDFITDFECYARPEDKPSSLDANNYEEQQLQEKYMINGFKQDFTELFMFEIVEVSFQTMVKEAH